MTAKDTTDVVLDWYMDDDISYEEEQKHRSGEDGVVPAVVSSPQLNGSSDEENISNEEVDAFTRMSHGFLAASCIG